MTITYDWRIANLERETEDGYVFTAYWTLDAISSDALKAHSYGSVYLERPEDGMIPFDELTEEIVIGWVKESLGENKVNGLQSALAEEIENQINPATETGVPWPVETEE